MKKNERTLANCSGSDIETFGDALLGSNSSKNALKILGHFKEELDHLESKLPPPNDRPKMIIDELAVMAAMADPLNFTSEHLKIISKLKDTILKLTVVFDRGYPAEKIMVDTLVYGIIKLNSELKKYSGKVSNQKQQLKAKEGRGGDVIKSLVETITKQNPKESSAKELWPEMLSALQEEFDDAIEVDRYQKKGSKTWVVRKEKDSKTWAYRYTPNKGNEDDETPVKTLTFKTFQNLWSKIRNQKMRPEKNLSR